MPDWFNILLDTPRKLRKFQSLFCKVEEKDLIQEKKTLVIKKLEEIEIISKEIRKFLSEN